MTKSLYDALIATRIGSCAASVEALLTTHHATLTLGGEPTFIPLDPQGAEWATAALGPTKLDYARRFAQAMIESVRPGAVLLETSGKHYPGEPLPRWTLLLQWRADGTPVWHDRRRLRTGNGSPNHSLAHAAAVITTLTQRLDVSPKSVLPLIEPGQPANRTSGYVLPLDREADTWRSDNWSESLGSAVVELLPGDSVAGLRLPLARLPEERLRRALTIEIKDNGLCIFVPPLLLESYLELLTAIEAALETHSLDGCQLTGYTPPPDPRLPSIGFASDPGVIEINLTPCATWAAYALQMNQLYAAASCVGLCARKLQFNGRPTGTGGGSHLVFGGPTSETSPFFTRPAFLPSIIRYFQHHPALSYAFTGQYLGPSSQAPRIDESTFEALYELEIACAGAAQFGSPWNLPLYDLLFRDLLMDRSGNTHRAEISVDKLWNPFAGNGRLGLVELRAFETHPEAAALSVTALFIRAVFARLLADPFDHSFIRWAGALHDRFFLSTFVWEDLATICADLQAHGLPFEVEWLRPLWLWRFPEIGTLALPGGHTLAFRQALEAWPLLGESPNAGGVARTVDASMDRIEAFIAEPAVLEQGLLLVNGYPCEFQPSESGGAAAGIRYRAFYLHPALHPHVPIHAPLLIEWVDRTTLCVCAAARWHVWNPRNQPYERRPADEAEAKTRFTERWESWPHTVGQTRFIPKVDFPPEGRHTLDLRRYPAQTRA